MDAGAEVFHYCLKPLDGEDLASKAERLAQIIAEHAEDADFARAISHAQIRLGEFGGESMILVPFCREDIRDMTTINYYIVARAEEVSIQLVGLILPDGDEVCLV